MLNSWHLSLVPTISDIKALKSQKLGFALILKIADMAWSITNRMLLFVPLALLVYLFLLLVGNSSRGFDITDESYYVIWASQPETIFASTTQFGYYTRLLYLISGQNIAVFRAVGVICLFASAWFFAYSLDRYWHFSSGQQFNTRNRWKEISLLSIGCLAYYKSWLITPSYNWLALIGVLIAGAGLIRVTTKNYSPRGMREPIPHQLANGLLVGIGGGLTFMAKPTTALVLALTALFWVALHYLRCKLKLFFMVALCTSCLFLLMHAIVFKGGITHFYYDLREGLQLESLLVGGQPLENLVWQAIGELEPISESLFQLAPNGFRLFPVVIFLVWWMKKRGFEIPAISILSGFLIIFNLFIWYRLWETGRWSTWNFGFSGIVWSIALLSSALLSLCAYKQNTSESRLKIIIHIVTIYLFILMLAFATAFGSTNLLVRQMSFGFVFLAAATMLAAFWIDQHIGRKILGSIIPILVSISVLHVMMVGIKHPYRLPSKISDQVIECSFYNSNGSLKVDSPTAEYINGLKRIAQKSGWQPGTPLIDLTGGSPGATLILGGRTMGTPWLLGGYPGSTEFAKKVIEKVPVAVQKAAWVLTAPQGKRSLPGKLLVEIGLKFPEEYISVGKVKTGHRDELQILWRPLNFDAS